MLYQRFTNEMNEINNIKFVCNKLSHKHDVLILLYKAQYFNNRWSIHNIPITRTILMNIHTNNCSFVIILTNNKPFL